MKQALTLAAALAILSFGAQAQTRDPSATPRIDGRQAKQEARIGQGVASGALTARETHRLQAQQHRIGHMESRAKADGVVTQHERAHLTHAQHHASRSIYRQKHDRQQRGGR